ncbi:MAG: SGNH/GDSL hydrolase family protein [Bacteroidia bacterium]|nr:SGNH/GDSL hydrolase family protein [Bacteroidia bacterium]
MQQASDFNTGFKHLLRYFLAVSFFVAACNPKLDEPRYTEGNADFSSYVAIGSGFMAGYMDGALTRNGQLQSLPALLSSRFALAGGGTFKQPLVNPGDGFGFDFITQAPVGRIKLVNEINCLGKADLGLKVLSINPDDYTWIGNLGPYNNLAVPGAKSFNLYSQTFGKNSVNGSPYFHRFASDTGTVGGLSSTVLGDASQLDATFFTLWIGTSDLLAYSLAGGKTNGNPFFDLTPTSVFDAAIDTIVESLTTNGAEGLIANIPDITELPFFSTIPYNGLVLTQAQADSLNLVSPGIVFEAGANGFVAYTGATGGPIKQLGEGELILSSVSLDDIRCNKLGTTLNPIPSEYILDSTEVQNIRQSLLSYNAKLRNVANAYNLAYCDMNGFFKTLSKGIVYNGASYSNAFITGGAFSLDGIHPNGRGYALIANEFVRVINARFNSNLPFVDVNASTGIIFP